MSCRTDISLTATKPSHVRFHRFPGVGAGKSDAAHQGACSGIIPPPDAKAAQVPEGYQVEVVLSGLQYPSSSEEAK